jgi:hypothetical protein
MAIHNEIEPGSVKYAWWLAHSLEHKVYTFYVDSC